MVKLSRFKSFFVGEGGDSDDGSDVQEVDAVVSVDVGDEAFPRCDIGGKDDEYDDKLDDEYEDAERCG